MLVCLLSTGIRASETPPRGSAVPRFPAGFLNTLMKEHHAVPIDRYPAQKEMKDTTRWSRTNFTFLRNYNSQDPTPTFRKTYLSKDSMQLQLFNRLAFESRPFERASGEGLWHAKAGHAAGPGVPDIKSLLLRPRANFVR